MILYSTGMNLKINLLQVINCGKTEASKFNTCHDYIKDTSCGGFC